MVIQIISLHLNPFTELTGPNQHPACKEALSALSTQLKPRSILCNSSTSDPAKADLIIALNPTTTSLDISTSTTLLTPLLPHCESSPTIQYLDDGSAHELASFDGHPCDILTLHFPTSISPEQRSTCLQALDWLLTNPAEDQAGNTADNDSCLGKICGYPTLEHGGLEQSTTFKAYILWKSADREAEFKAHYGGRTLWYTHEGIGIRKWREGMGFYEALGEIWATDGIEVEEGWIRQLKKEGEGRKGKLRRLSRVKDWVNGKVPPHPSQMPGRRVSGWVDE